MRQRISHVRLRLLPYNPNVRFVEMEIVYFHELRVFYEPKVEIDVLFTTFLVDEEINL